MRILLVSGEYPPMQGGVADFTQIMADRFSRRGHAVCVLTSTGAGADEGAIQVEPVMGRWGWLNLYRAIRRMVATFRPDVINIQYQAAAFGMHPAINLLPRACVSRLLGRVPCVVTFHDLLVPYLFPKAGPLRWWVNLELARRSKGVIVTNVEDQLRLESEGHLPPVQRIPIGSNVSAQLPVGYDRAVWRRHWGLDPDALVMCYFGFLNASKGGEELIEALATLRQSDLDARLLMIGGSVGASDPTNAAYLARVRAAIAAQGLDEYVIWTGYLSDEEVSASFAAADLCVLPYRDGVSFRRGSLMAALTHGLPIVSTEPHVPVPEIVHGENLWLVPPRDAAALAAAIQALGRDPSLRERLGRGAAELAGLFDWDLIAERTLAFFGEILGPADAEPTRGRASVAS
jgi:glycosyltransferase involved in cell wall biosynthesis